MDRMQVVTVTLTHSLPLPAPSIPIASRHCDARCRRTCSPKRSECEQEDVACDGDDQSEVVLLELVERVKTKIPRRERWQVKRSKTYIVTVVEGMLLLRRAALLAASAGSRSLSSCVALQGVEVEQFPCLSDNYGYLLHDKATQLTAAIDTPEVGPIMAALERRGWRLSHIFNTHHHNDHAGGNDELVRRTGCRVVGPAAEANKIKSIDSPLSGGDSFKLGEQDVRVIDVGGHTLGHIAFYLPDAGLAFVGDSLFALGCGRLFEGTPVQAWESLQRLAALPPETVIYCAHEYTAANLKFALTVEPHNPALQARAVQIKELRAKDLPTVPTTLSLELETNPFLRPSSPLLREHLGISPSEADVDVFATIRKMKDNA